MTEQSVQDLVKKFFLNECTLEERQELARWVDQSATDFTLRKVLEDAWKEYEPVERIPENRSNQMLSSILNRETEAVPVEVPVRHLWLKRIAVAAVVAVVIGSGSYYLFFNQPSRQVAVTTPSSLPISNDVVPGRTTAILTLADGSTVTLDTSANRTIAQQGATQVSAIKGELVYNSSADNSLTTLFNSLNTHRGQLFPLNLSDGTKVWLNSASSLRYPVAFNGSERVVDLTGEAYFEVAKNPGKPFKVRLNGLEIEVLGTHFNINGYADEPVVKTTLIEGSLRVTKGNAGILLTPGQQAGLKSDGKIELIKNANTEEAVSWKDGYFHFDNASLENVMRQLSRWYDVDVEYESKQPGQEFSGDIRKTVNLSDALKWLELSQIHCKIIGKKIIVSR